MKKVKIVQLDGSLMNLALSKIARYHVNQGDSVSFTEPNPDLLYASAIFDWTAKRFKDQRMLGGTKVILGGYPFSDVQLDPKIDALMPLYSLWNTDYSLGYTSRGCIRQCDFCIVPRVEGYIRDYQPISQFHDLAHRRIILLDNNFLASPNWRQNTQYLQENGLEINFCQGLDIRLLNEDNVRILADLKYQNLHGTHHQLTFAFDSSKIVPEVRHGLDLLINAGFKRENIQFYVLVGYDETFEQEQSRCSLLWKEYGVMPYVMLFNGTRDPKRRSLARFYNKRVQKVTDFENYVEARHKKLVQASALDQWE